MSSTRDAEEFVLDSMYEQWENGHEEILAFVLDEVHRYTISDSEAIHHIHELLTKMLK